jgi:hypothetical protein
MQKAKAEADGADVGPRGAAEGEVFTKKARVGAGKADGARSGKGDKGAVAELMALHEHDRECTGGGALKACVQGVRIVAEKGALATAKAHNAVVVHAG